MAGTAAENARLAAEHLIDAFRRFDKAAYFACFDPSASFIFYNSPTTFYDRASYEEAWDEWTAEGWSVIECRSTNGRVRMLNADIALFSHEVETTLFPVESPTVLHERESIIFARSDTGWLAVHEHLSPLPE
jgi:hypothetical protein